MAIWAYVISYPNSVSIRPDGFDLLSPGDVKDRNLLGYTGVHTLEYVVSGSRASIVVRQEVDLSNFTRA